jgi:hypothetical protein
VTALRPLRILLDVNILISHVLSRAVGRRETTSQKLVDAMLSGFLGDQAVQLERFPISLHHSQRP